MLLLSSLSGLLVTFAQAAGGLSIGMSKTSFSTDESGMTIHFTVKNGTEEEITNNYSFEANDPSVTIERTSLTAITVPAKGSEKVYARIFFNETKTGTYYVTARQDDKAVATFTITVAAAGTADLAASIEPANLVAGMINQPVKISITNTTNHTITGIPSLKTTAAGVEFTHNSSTISLSAGQTQSLSATVKIPKDFRPGSYALSVKIGESQSSDAEFTITSAASDPNITFEQFDLPSSCVAGGNFTLKLKYSTQGIDSLFASLDNQNFWFKDKSFSQSMDMGSSVSQAFEITSSPSLPSGVAMIELTISYTESATQKKVTTNVSVPINIVVPSDTSDPEEPEIPDSILKPYIFIDKYSYGGALVPGNDIPLYFRMVNLSSSAALQNIMVSLAPSGAVALKGTSDKIYIKEMATGGVMEKSLTLSSMDTIDSTSVQVTLEFTYEYFLNDAYQTGSCTQTLNIPVVKIGADTGEVKDRFEISSVTPPDMLIAGEEGYATVIVINKGKEAAGNVSVTVLGDNLSNNGYTEYYGAVAPNSKAEIEVPITPASSGDISFKLMVSYEDTKENVKELEKEMTVTATSYDEPVGPIDPIDPMEPVDPNPSETGLSPLAIALIVAGSLIVVLVVVSIVVKRVRARRNEVEDEDL